MNKIEIMVKGEVIVALALRVGADGKMFAVLPDYTSIDLSGSLTVTGD